MHFSSTDVTAFRREPPAVQGQARDGEEFG